MAQLTVELGDDVLRQVEEQAAARSQSAEDFVSEIVAREVLPWDQAWEIFDNAREKANLSEDAAIESALREVRAVRDRRPGGNA
ncbi:MAG: hypothetical protein WD557_11480 [Dehalococcoidia bacterium]